MKRITLFLTIYLMCLTVFSQQITYDLKQNIHYYNDSINQLDNYVNERCVLDIYYPKNSNNFATIVWIHGGGLTSWQKEIPEELKNKFDELPDLRTAFKALTPGRQRGYILHFSQPKQSKTRVSRIEKCIPQILNGKGLND